MMTNSDDTGFCVPHTVQDSPGKGRGVFINATIRKGTILWRHKPGQFSVYDEHSLTAFLATLPNRKVVYELEYIFGYPEFPGHVIRVHDNGVLINHSRQPTVALNSGCEDNEIQHKISSCNVTQALLNDRFALVAIRDLKAGDELTMDYRFGTQEPAYYDALCKQYDLEWPWL